MKKNKTMLGISLFSILLTALVYVIHRGSGYHGMNHHEVMSAGTEFPSYYNLVAFGFFLIPLVLFIVAVFMYRKSPTNKAFPLLISLVLSLTSISMIMGGNGMIEYHFSVFVVIALVAFYDQTKLIVMISVIFALQHFFGLFFDGLSYLVFGVAGYSWSMMMIHVIAVILMAVAIIVQIRTRQTLFEESETDHLTKALNRRAILRKIREFHEQEPHAKGSLIFFDLDHFKKVNDTYGHEAGDELLIEFAKVIKEAVCEEANVARYGGEEFVIFLPYCDTEQAVQSAEELRKMIETTDFFVTNALAVNDKKLGIRITSSIGVANYPDHSTEIDDLIRYADRAMYVGAKMTGRNQVSLFDPTM